MTAGNPGTRIAAATGTAAGSGRIAVRRPGPGPGRGRTRTPTGLTRPSMANPQFSSLAA